MSSRPLRTPRSDSRLHAMPSGLLLSLGTARWLDVDVSRDGGATWKAELSTFDYEASKAQTAPSKKP